MWMPILTVISSDEEFRGKRSIIRRKINYQYHPRSNDKDDDTFYIVNPNHLVLSHQLRL